MKFRTKSIEITARQWFSIETDYHDVRSLNSYAFFNGKCHHCCKKADNHGWIETLEGGHIVCPLDWIITNAKGEKYPCKPNIFESTYEKV